MDDADADVANGFFPTDELLLFGGTLLLLGTVCRFDGIGL